MKIKDTQNRLRRRRARVRSRISGTASRPRLSVFVSNRHIYAQLIDDQAGHTILGIHLKSLGEKATVTGAEKLGQKVAEQAKEQKVGQVVFDRGTRHFAGKVKAVAEGARAGGLNF